MSYNFTLSYEFCANNLIRFRVKGGIHDSYEIVIQKNKLVYHQGK